MNYHEGTLPAIRLPAMDGPCRPRTCTFCAFYIKDCGFMKVLFKFPAMIAFEVKAEDFPLIQKRETDTIQHQTRSITGTGVFRFVF